MNENDYEYAILELFQKDLGYGYTLGSELTRNTKDSLLADELEKQLRILNPKMAAEGIEYAIKKLMSPEGTSLIERNRTITDYLQNGINVNYIENGEEKHDLVYLIDYNNTKRNSFRIVNQFTLEENGETKRADIVVFVNGIPLAVMELKSPEKEDAEAESAYKQIRNYMKIVPSLFDYNVLCVISDMLVNKAGTITSPLNRFMEWKSTDGSTEERKIGAFDTFYKGIFQKDRLLDIVKNFILFSRPHEKDVKIMAGYHQYFAVRKAVKQAVRAAETDGKGGVMWHTQGSGKSFSMVFYAHLLQQVMNSPTIVVMTDRIDLDDQLYRQFAQCSDFLRQKPKQAESKEELRRMLEGTKVNGIIFSTIYKFDEVKEPLSKRRNIIVLADEAHRGQYGLDDKVVMRKDAGGNDEAVIVQGLARQVRNALPYATFVGFTGTPVSLKDRNTREVFGDYIDIYDMTQAVEDGATVPVYYESRVVKLKLNQETLTSIDKLYTKLADNATEAAIAQSKRMMSGMEVILGEKSTIDSLCRDILDHYENNRADHLTGKAMIVAYNRDIAVKIYHKLLELRPGDDEWLKVVMTGTNQDPEEWYELSGNKAYRDELAVKFKDESSALKIVIVVDMWLTGFDLPSLATMYFYRPMQGYGLMQAITRVNRVYPGKQGGLIVDYVGIVQALKMAMNEYSKRDKKKFGDPDIGKTAYKTFKEKLQVCQDLMHGFPMPTVTKLSKYELAKLITSAVNYLLDVKQLDVRDTFLKEAKLLANAHSLCSSLTTSEERPLAAFFETVRYMIMKFETSGGNKEMSLHEINRQVSELLSAAVESDGVLSIFDCSSNKSFNLFDPEVLKEIAAMKHKNLALETLKRLMQEKLGGFKKSNLVKSEEFSELLKGIMNKYYNGHLTNSEVIEELLKLAQEIQKLDQVANDLGLTDEELAFYSALTKPAAIKDFYTNDQLIALTHELTELLRKSRTIDWQLKDTARAAMRVSVKRLLRKYKYPPEGLDEALQTVISQCELWADEMA